MANTGSGIVISGTEQQTEEKRRAFSPLSVWALSFGCAVGWGAFVMPGTTFLPAAGPLGTVIGIAIGAIVMFIIGMNYHYLMNRYPEDTGTLSYTIRTFGYDHGFMSAWFLVLVYVAILWANATALGLISRKLMHDVFRFGFHYQILGYDVYFGEVLLSIAAIVICGMVCIAGKRFAAGVQVLLAILLFGGVAVCATMVLRAHGLNGDIHALYPALLDGMAGGIADGMQAGSGRGLSVANLAGMAPLFAQNGILPIRQIFTIVALSPWAYVGFESVSNATPEFRFPVKKTIWIFAAALFAGAFCYSMLTVMATRILPGYHDWSAYIRELGEWGGVAGLPTFFAARVALAQRGISIPVLEIAAFAGIMTGLVGNFIAASRLLAAMAREGMLPQWFGKENDEGNPRNALLFLTGISVLIPFLGRTAIGWIVDVNTVGATIAYAYTSADAFVVARKEQNKRIQVTGCIGLVMSGVFFLYFMAWSAGAMSTESYLILAGWSILGFVYFRFVFGRDKDRRFGKSTIVWIGLLFLIFFTSLMWVKQASDDMTEKVVDNIRIYYEEHNTEMDAGAVAEAENYFAEQLNMADRVLTRNSIIQMVLIVASLAIMFSIYTTISKREKQMEIEKIAAQESNRAKTVFLSNMSHDIRTPMNAIIGYVNLAEREDITLEETKDYLGKIKNSSHHLLALINDVLEMSRIESGKMELEPIAVDLRKSLGEVRDLFATQMSGKKIDFTVDTAGIRDSRVYCDKNRLNRVLQNLVSNAYKFTPEGGKITVTAKQLMEQAEAVSGNTAENPETTLQTSGTGNATGDFGTYEIRVKDSGIGMSKEFAAKVFEAFERERTSTVSKIQGTGLGMAITKSIVDLMGGTIEVQTEQGKGTEFIIRLSLKLQEMAGETEAAAEDREAEEKQPAVDFSTMRLLLVDDVEINREIATMQLESFGFEVEIACNGEEAVQKVRKAKPGYYNAVLMDIQMPVMNGYEATRTIRSISDDAYAKIPIIAMTADAFSEDVKKALDAGMNAHIAKPINVDVMISVLSDVLSG